METKRLIGHTIALLVVVTLAGVDDAGSVLGQENPIRLTSESSTVNRNISQSVERLEMLVKSSRILTLEERIPKFQVHNEGILGATPVSQNQIQIFAKAPGSTQLNLWDTNDKLYTVDVTVMPDAREVEGILASQLPMAALKVLPINDSAVVSGTVTSVDDVDRALAIVEQFYTNVVNNTRVVGVQQILLHTKIMEVSRTKLRDLGVDWGTFFQDGFILSGPGNSLDLATSGFGAGPLVGDGIFFPTAEGALTSTNKLVFGGGDFAAMINALRRQDLIKFLAEPTVVATHGRPARFNVGGKVPYLVPTGNGAIAVEYEEFGTAVDFLPFVVGPGRVRLEIRPEVSELDASNSIVAQGISVPGFRSRYVETAVEMQAGQTFAIAGLLQSRTESVTRATPFLGEIPYIGSMFRRVREERNDIELLITVTPEFVSAMDPHEVPRGGPGLNSRSPDDCELFAYGHIEVPNNLGDDCGCPPGANVAGGDGFTTMDSGVAYGDSYGVPYAGEVVPPQGEMYGGAVLAPGTNQPRNHQHQSLPPGAIVPGPNPVEVGDGVTIMAPQQ